MQMFVVIGIFNDSYAKDNNTPGMTSFYRAETPEDAEYKFLKSNMAYPFRKLTVHSESYPIVNGEE